MGKCRSCDHDFEHRSALVDHLLNEHHDDAERLIDREQIEPDNLCSTSKDIENVQKVAVDVATQVSHFSNVHVLASDVNDNLAESDNSTNRRRFGSIGADDDWGIVSDKSSNADDNDDGKMCKAEDNRARKSSGDSLIDKFVCNGCKYECSAHKNIVRHFIRTHLKQDLMEEIVNGDQTTCNICSKKLSRKASLRYHLVMVHGKLRDRISYESVEKPPKCNKDGLCDHLVEMHDAQKGKFASKKESRRRKYRGINNKKLFKLLLP